MLFLSTWPKQMHRFLHNKSLKQTSRLKQDILTVSQVLNQTCNLHPNQILSCIDPLRCLPSLKLQRALGVDPLGSSEPTHAATIYISPTINTRSRGL